MPPASVPAADLRPPHGIRLPGVLGAADAAVDCGILLLACFTLLYHATLLAGVTAPVAVPVLIVATAVTLGLAALWRVRWPSRDEVSSFEAAAVLAWAAAAAVFAWLFVRPDADDAYYVDRSRAVADTGGFPTRDTVFSDGALPGLAELSPPVPSWEPFLGAVARATGLDPITIVHVVVPPLVATAAVLMLARLLRVWGVRAVWAALTVGLVYLMAGGAAHASFGNLHAGRAWQGKVVFVAVLVPYLYAVLAERRVSRTQTVLLVTAGSITAVGLTTTAVFAVPIIGLLAAAARRRVPDGLVAGSVLLYPVLAGCAVVLGGEAGPAAAPFAAPGPLELATKVLGSGWYAVVGLVGVLVGVAGIRRPGARRHLAVAVGVAVAGLAVGGAAVVAAVTGAAPVVWRLAWVLPVPALVGAASTALGGRRWALALPAAACAVLVAVGTPLWSPLNGGRVDPGAAELPPGARNSAEAVAEWAGPGTVLVPQPVSAALPVVASRPFPVAPRADYVRGLSHISGFAAQERLQLQAWVDGAPPPEALDVLLDQVGVTAICLPPLPGAPDELLPTGSALRDASWQGVGGLLCARVPF